MPRGRGIYVDDERDQLKCAEQHQARKEAGEEDPKIAPDDMSSAASDEPPD